MKKLTIAQQLEEEKKKTKMQSDSLEEMMGDLVAINHDLEKCRQARTDDMKDIRRQLSILLGMRMYPRDPGSFAPPAAQEPPAPFELFAEIGKLIERASFASKFEELYARYDELREMLTENQV